MAADLLERTKVLTLTTTGRVSGELHAVDLWFVYHVKAGAIYLLSYPGTSQRGTDWYHNALANPQVEIDLRGERMQGLAEPAPNKDVEKIEAHIRNLFTDKYGPAMISHYYGDETRLPLKIKIASDD